MAMTSVGLRADAVADRDSERTVPYGATRNVNLTPQGLSSGEIIWYSTEVNDSEADDVVVALLSLPDVDSAYRQPPSSPAG